MQVAILAVMGAVTGMAMRRMVFWRRCGYPGRARRLYRRGAWLLGGTAWLAMAAQELILWGSGLLTWQTGLPLHLCSAAGLLTLPMLLSGKDWLWHASLYVGLPGALAAILFPSVLHTRWPQATELAFHTMHCAIVLAPLLPFALGRRPHPLGAATAWLCLMALGGAALAVNDVTGGNYLFLSRPVQGTPLMLPASFGLRGYRLALAALATLVLAAEGAAAAVLGRSRLYSRRGIF